MKDLRSRAEGFLEHASGRTQASLDDLPMFLENQVDNLPLATTWSEFVQLVLSRFIDGAPLDDPEVKNNLSLIMIGLDGATEPDLHECQEILEGIWTQVYHAQG
jgi:hypothetical protein